MLKLKFCENIGQKCGIFHAGNVPSNILRHISLFSQTAFPAETNEHDFVSKRRHSFREKQSFPRSTNPNLASGNERSWGRPLKPFKRESEQEFLVRMKNDPDTFGGPLEQEIIDDGDIQEDKHFTEQVEHHQKLRTTQYADLIKKYISQRQIKEAIDVLEIRMLKEDRVKPEAYIYNLLLGACGRVGYTKKAFMLYNQMKKRGLKATGGTYTALFNVCANSPWASTDGLTRAKHLYDIMIEKGDQPNDTNYNAMIKAFGRCGDLSMAFNLVDEMAQKGFVIKDDTISFLLQACISDKEAGFRHSLLVWRKVVEKNIYPGVYTFNLLLRCVRDCGLGDLEATQDVISKLVKKGDSLTALPEGESQLQSKKEDDVEKNKKNLGKIGDKNQLHLPTKTNHVEVLDLRPNLLALKPHLGSVLSLSEVTTPEDRLLLLGGFQGFLKTMSDFKCTPDIKTFSQLLDSIPSTNAAEKQLMVAMKKLNVQPDIDFYNMLIKKKSMRCDYQGAKEVLISMKQMKFRPNLITYGVLAMGCSTKEEAFELLDEMKAASYSLNAAILGAMMKQACYHKAHSYIFAIMELCVHEQVPINKRFLEHLDTFKANGRAKLDAKKLNKVEEKLFGIFRARYKTWLTEIQIDDNENAHPWQQYRQNYPADMNTRYKEKDTARFKPRHASLFKVKTSKKYENNR